MGAVRRRARFQDIGLARNPFGELTREERAAAAQVDLTEEAAFLEGPRRCVQFVGDHGRGKSTRLIALRARHFPDSSYVQMRTRGPAPEVAPPWPFFLDSLELMGRGDRRRLYARAEGLACTTHADLSRELERAGYEVRTIRVRLTGVDELEAITAARVELARAGDHAPLPTRARLEELHASLGDDVRSIEGALYLDYQRLRDAHVPLQTRDRAR